MIKIDLATAISVYLIISICIVFVLWIFYNYRDMKSQQNSGEFRQCPYCTFLFLDVIKKTAPTCPRCHSYLDKNEGKGA